MKNAKGIAIPAVKISSQVDEAVLPGLKGWRIEGEPKAARGFIGRAPEHREVRLQPFDRWMRAIARPYGCVAEDEQAARLVRDARLRAGNRLR